MKFKFEQDAREDCWHVTSSEKWTSQFIALQDLHGLSRGAGSLPLSPLDLSCLRCHGQIFF